MRLDVLVLLILTSLRAQVVVSVRSFPKDFLFGVATSAYQIEGGWNEDGKGESIWDYFTNAHPEKIADGKNGNVACNSYHKIQEDVRLIKNLGVDFYRFSLSWARILPTGFPYKVNPDGILYYNTLLDELRQNGIRSMVTMYHWDLPLNLQQMGGWTNEVLVDAFLDYAKVVLQHFGDRVDFWVTLNSDCDMYGSLKTPPMVGNPGLSEYLCGHNQIKAHAKVYRMYKEEFPNLKGKMGMTSAFHWFEPASNSSEDLKAAERARQFAPGWLSHPIYHRDGDYPQVLKERVRERSFLEGLSKSRLPAFTLEEIDYIKGGFDFLGVNIYTAVLVAETSEGPLDRFSFENDVKVVKSVDSRWPTSNAAWLKVVPESARNFLKWLKAEYGDIPMIITENGYSSKYDLDDFDRINYYKLYLNAILDAILEDKVNVIGYTAWSLFDNFEWLDGYTQKFGLYHVDFESPNLTRTEKRSAKLYKQIISQRRLETIKEEL